VPANAALTHSSSFIVAAGHPAIPGHFPGNPIVPGVMIVDLVLDAAEDWLGRRLHVTELPQAKFVAPLRPGERADVTLVLKKSTLTYEVHHGDELISRGTLRLSGLAAP
jgi:3-hydroxyacyl-[acyl-carrier-protein] dehydratase